MEVGFSQSRRFESLKSSTTKVTSGRVSDMKTGSKFCNFFIIILEVVSDRYEDYCAASRGH